MILIWVSPPKCDGTSWYSDDSTSIEDLVLLVVVLFEDCVNFMLKSVTRMKEMNDFCF